MMRHGKLMIEVTEGDDGSNVEVTSKGMSASMLWTAMKSFVEYMEESSKKFKNEQAKVGFNEFVKRSTDLIAHIDEKWNKMAEQDGESKT
jgi:hypothetical protein